MTKIVIIGSSIAGVSAAAAARKQDPDASISIYSKDTKLPYYRLRIGEVLADPAMAEKLTLHPQSWYDDRKIDLNLNQTVTAIDPDNKQITLENGNKVDYDKLILAQGSHSFVPPIKGKDLAGVLTLWYMDEALKIEDKLSEGKNAVIIGGGLLGLETAYNVAKHGIDTTIIETSDRLLARQLDEGGSAVFTKQVLKQNVHPVLSGSVIEIKADASGEKVGSVELKDGTSIPADIVIISTGVRPNVDLLEGLDIEIGRHVVCNDRMETSIPDIYAAGDVMEQDGQWYGQWSISKSQGTVAGTNAAGGDATYTIQPPPYTMNTMDTKVASGGTLNGADVDNYNEEVKVDEEHLDYYKVSKSGDKVIGFALVGNTKDYLKLSKAMKED
ncbi:MAG TPA: NAD(P)/FAD-dependent oxidoreductase [Clostridiaceae bacterium]|nr:NAD(P)/FAD-dependent oxidoreductase [Clostridiaceae bacterium]